MDMHEAEMKRAELTARLRQGQITMEGYTAAISALRVTDISGRVWQPDPGGTGWLVWNGSAWQPGTPPVTGYAGSPPPVQTAKRPQKWGDLLSILGGIAGVVIWFLSGARGNSEGLALITPVLMIAIPVVLVVFRPTIDQVLQPLQPYRKKVSKILLIALGIATPFLSAWVLGTVFHIGLFPLMQVNMIIGTFAAYIITRDPSPVPGRQNSHKPVAGQAMIIFTIMFCSLIVAPVFAAGFSCDLNGRWEYQGQAEMSTTALQGSDVASVSIPIEPWRSTVIIDQSGNSVVIRTDTPMTGVEPTDETGATSFKFTMMGKTATKEFTSTDKDDTTSAVTTHKQVFTVSDDCNSFTLEDNSEGDRTSDVMLSTDNSAWTKTDEVQFHETFKLLLKGTRLSGGTAPGTPVPGTPASGATAPVTSAPVTPESVTDTVVSAGIIATIFSGLVNAPIIIQGILQGAAGAGTAGAGVEPPAPRGGQYIGDKRSFTDPRGVQREATLQADGHWRTDEGSWVDFDRLDEAKRQFQDDQARSAKQREIIERQEDAHSRETAALLQRQAEQKKVLDNLQHMQNEVTYGNKGDLWKPGEPGDVNKNINEVINQILNRDKVDTSKYEAIKKVYGDRVSGKTIDEKDIPSDNQITRETITGGIEGTSREVFTGMDADGNFSKSSLAVRILAGALTLGKSEMVYQPVSAGFTMEDYVNKGGDSIVGGFTEAIVEVAKGELIGRGIGGALTIGGKVASVVGQAVAESIPNTIIKPIQNAITKVGNVLNTEIKNPFTGGRPPVSPKIPGSAGKGVAEGSGSSTGSSARTGGKAPEGLTGTHSPPKTTQEIMDAIKRRKETGSSTPGLPEPTFKPTGDPPTAECKNMTVRDQKAFKVVAEKHGAKMIVRPGKEDGFKLIKEGKAHPKPELLKSKTIESDDVKLGFREDHKGMTACKEPVLPKRPPDMSDADWKTLNDRSVERMKEFKAEKPHLEQLETEGKINWDRKTGLITDAKTGKPFASDNDAFGYVDAQTGKPVSPFTQNQINKELQGYGATKHDEQLGWDFSKSSDTPPVGGGKSEFDIKAGIDNKILNTHVEGGKPLDAYNPLTGKWEKTWYTGGTQRTFVNVGEGGEISKVLSGRIT